MGVIHLWNISKWACWEPFPLNSKKKLVLFDSKPIGLASVLCTKHCFDIIHTTECHYLKKEHT